jgi:hypothetical protein
VTAEHVFPEWLSERIKADAKGKGAVGTFTVIASVGKVRQVPLMDLKSKRFCESCNTKWLNGIENEAQPIIERMLEGQPTTLTLDEQRLLAIWVYKTMLTLLSTEKVRPPDELYRAFRFSRFPLAPVWLGAMEPITDLGVQYSSRIIHFGSEVPPDSDPGAWQVLFAIRRIFFGIFQVLDLKKSIDFKMPFSTYRLIWPPKANDIPWPTAIVTKQALFFD